MTDLEKNQTLQFSLDWKSTVLALLLLPCLILLGCWQLDRAEEKRELKRLFEQRKILSPVDITDLSQNQDLRYRRVRLRGEFVNQQVLFLDNRIHRGQFGYDVVNPFKLINSDLWVMVNRGWIQGDRSRRTLPAINVVEGEVELLGEIYVPQGKMLSLGARPINTWPRVVQSLDIEALSQSMGKNIFPYSVRVDVDAKGAYFPNWIVVNVQPQKHIAYAFQWFAMAVTLLFIVLLVNTNLWELIKRPKN